MDRPTLSPRSRGVNIDNSLIPKKGRCVASRVEGTKCLRRWTPPTRRKSGPPTELVLRKQVQRIYRQNLQSLMTNEYTIGDASPNSKS